MHRFSIANLKSGSISFYVHHSVFHGQISCRSPSCSVNKQYLTGEFEIIIHFIINVSNPFLFSVNFTGKYEIHRVYVRSTARIFEIYYSTDLKDTSKDYLCTVRCGIAAQEPLPSGEECRSQCSSNATTGEKHEQETKSLTSSSDEDSWVEVKIPESTLGKNTPDSQERNVIGSCQKNTLVFLHLFSSCQHSFLLLTVSETFLIFLLFFLCNPGALRSNC